MASGERLVTSLLERGVMIEPEALAYLIHHPDVLEGRDLTGMETVTIGFLQRLTPPLADAGIRILENYQERFNTKGEVADFLNYFNSRYQKLAALLRNRPDMKNLISANKIAKLAGREEVSVIGLIYDRHDTPTGHTILNVEDQTGIVKVMISKNSPVHKRTAELVVDEAIGVRGQAGRNIIFAEDLIFPDVPSVPWSQGQSIGVFLSDIHVGSKNFMEEEFKSFISWLKSNDDIPHRVRYVFIAGDLVDGVGVYKGQQKDLEITDIEKQYDRFAELLAEIPKELKIFVAPGNHDASREAEPQPAIPSQFAPKLYELKNVTMVSSPAFIQVEGIGILMYHGTSLDSVIDSIPSLRKTGYYNPHQAMIQQLRKRHLMPSYGEKARIFPDPEDNLVIGRIPNIFHSGHVHSIGFSNYKGIRIINSGTFQQRTAFQVKIGHHPTPCKVPYVDFQTGDVALLDFSKEGQHPLEHTPTGGAQLSQQLAKAAPQISIPQTNGGTNK